MTALQALLKHADRFVGRLIIQLLPPSKFRDVQIPPRTVLFIRPGGIGDAVLLIPAVRALRRCFPGVSIDILAERRNAGVFALCPGIRSVRRYDVASEFRAALKSRYDLVIDTEQWHRLAAVATRLIRAGARIGFATNERRRLFTQDIPYEQDDYEADSFMRLLAPLGCGGGGEVDRPFFDIAERDAETAESLLAPLKGMAFVTLFPGASIAERRWGSVKFTELAGRLLNSGVGAVVVGGAVDREDAKVIDQAGALNLAGKTSLAETAAVLARSSLLVSGDSGILHIAVGLGVPTVSLFGPGRDKKWAPRGGNHIVINKHLPCSPCTTFGYTPKCPVNASCMADITVDEVESAVLALLVTKKIK